MTALTIVPLGTDLKDFEAALAGTGLPATDLREPGRLFFRFEDAAGLVGFAGIEGAGPDRLLRSLIIMGERRGAGLGSVVIMMLEAVAAKTGVATLHLLTIDAAPFFSRHGYEMRDRSAAPEAITASREFASLCPDSAAYMAKVVFGCPPAQSARAR